MRDTLLREKNQITLPSELVEQAGLKPGRDRIAFRFEGGEFRGKPVARKLTKADVMRAIDRNPLKINKTWEEIKGETR